MTDVTPDRSSRCQRSDVVKPNDIISAWLACLSIWGLAMLGLFVGQRPEVPVYQEPPSRGIMVEDWYAQGFPGGRTKRRRSGKPTGTTRPTGAARPFYRPSRLQAESRAPTTTRTTNPAGSSDASVTPVTT